MEKKKLSLLTKISYGASEVGAQFSWMLISSFLSVFYTDAVGISTLAVSMIFLGARIWDAINDPIMGFIADRTRSRWGRFRPYLLFGAPLLAISNVLTFTAFDLSPTAKIVYATITYIATGMIYTALCISQGALANVMTYDNGERMQLNTFRGIASSVGGLILNAATMPLILYFGGNTSSVKGYTRTTIVFSVVGMLCYWMTFANCKETIAPKAPSADKKKSMPTAAVLKTLFTHRDFMLELLFIVITLTAAGGRFSIISYYFIYTVERPELMSSIMLIGSFCCIFPQFFIPALTKRFSKKIILCFSNIGMALGVTIIFLAGVGTDRLPMIYIGTIIWGLSNVLSPVLYGMTAEMIDDIEVKTGMRLDGTGYSVFSFATKLAAAIGGSVGVALLGVIGYIPNVVQTDAIKQNIAALTNLAPAALYLVAMIPMLLITLNKKKADANEQTLRERREASVSE